MKKRRNLAGSFERALSKVMGELKSGKLYRDQLAAMKQTGIDPNKPIELGFADGTKATITPKDQIQHLKPKGRKPDTSGLLDADPKCKHKIVDAPGGGIKCTKCGGWFCY